MQIIIEIDDSLRSDVETAFAEYGGYARTIKNPEPKPAPIVTDDGVENQKELDAYQERLPNPVPLETHIKDWSISRIKELLASSASDKARRESESKFDSQIS